MKKLPSITALLLACILLAACGGKKDSGESAWRGIQAGMDDLSAITDRTEYYDIAAEQEPIFQWEQGQEGSPLSTKLPHLIGMQFYQGEPTQLWEIPSRDQYGILQSWDIRLYRPDGGWETLLSEIAISHVYHGYLDQEGNLYWWYNSNTVEYSDGRTEKYNTLLKKFDPSGDLLYEKQYEYNYDIQEIRQTADGRVYLFISDKETRARQLAELDPATGNAAELGAVSLSKELAQPHFGTWGEKLVTFKQSLLGDEVAAINIDDGSEASILSFQGTSYTSPTGFSLQDFRILEDESVEILWASGDGSKSLRERLRMEKVEKTPIVLRGLNISGWIAAQINSFNRQSEDYHVVVEDCGLGNDAEDFARLTSIQIASGKGPDIIEGGLMKDYMSGMMEKGALEDLRPYMEGSGIRETDYFPFTFNTWRDGDRIYGVSPASPGLMGFCMDSAVLGGTGEPDIGTLVSALLARHTRQAGQGKTIFLKGYDSQQLLTLFLEATDTLWGMVDWEKGSCDFSGDLFAQILETAKQYGDNGNSEEAAYIAERRSLFDVFEFDDRAERERTESVICGVMFDDGCHAAVSPYSVLAVNASSPHKEGAWEFISFLLGDDAQSVRSVGNGIPVSRTALGAWLETQRERVAGGKEIHKMLLHKSADGTTTSAGTVTYTEADITEEIIEEYIEMLEDARPYPIRTAPILDIISEEAADYFNGTKNAAEVGKVVTNRVQTYLDEGR